MFQLKIEILKILRESLIAETADGLWDKCLQSLSNTLSQEDFHTLSGVEEKFSTLSRTDIAHRLSFILVKNRPLNLTASLLNCGGIKNILGIIEFIERDISRHFKVSLPIKPEYYNTARAFTEYVQDKNIRANLVDRLINIENPKEGITPIKLSRGGRWEDITIEFVDGYVVRITAPGFRGRTDYIRMGFENKKTLSPNVQWKFLQELAVSYGEMSWRDVTETAIRNKKRKQKLSDTLKQYFQIDKDPFLPYKQARKYKTRFHLFPESDEGSGEFTEEPSIYLHQ